MIVKEIHGIKVVDLADVESLYGKKRGSLYRAFKRAKDAHPCLIEEGVHYIEASQSEWLESAPLIGGERKIIVVTARGFIVLSKFVSGALALKAQDLIAEYALTDNRSSIFEFVERGLSGVAFDLGKSFVYFVEADNGSVKIGFTKDLDARISAIRTNSPVYIKRVSFIEGDVAMEREIQDRFRSQRIKGECFSASKDILSFIDSKTTPWRS